MTKTRQNRRAALRAMKRYVRSVRPDASFIDLAQLQRPNPEVGQSFATVIAEAGYRPGEVLLYDHAQGTSVMFPPRAG